MARFSRRGERVTDFERALVAESDCARLTDARMLWVDLARRIGIDALAAVFDELGAEKVHLPTRESFFRMLFQQRRDAEIVRRLACGESASELAPHYGLSVRAVQHIGQCNRTDDVARSGMVDGAHD